MDLKILVLGLMILVLSSVTFAYAIDKESWCSTTPSFKPGCLKFLVTSDEQLYSEAPATIYADTCFSLAPRIFMPINTEPMSSPLTRFYQIKPNCIEEAR